MSDVHTANIFFFWSISHKLQSGRRRRNTYLVCRSWWRRSFWLMLLSPLLLFFVCSSLLAFLLPSFLVCLLLYVRPPSFSLYPLYLSFPSPGPETKSKTMAHWSISFDPSISLFCFRSLSSSLFFSFSQFVLWCYLPFVLLSLVLRLFSRHGLSLAFINPENAMRSCLGNGMHRGGEKRDHDLLSFSAESVERRRWTVCIETAPFSPISM